MELDQSKAIEDMGVLNDRLQTVPRTWSCRMRCQTCNSYSYRSKYNGLLASTFLCFFDAFFIIQVGLLGTVTSTVFNLHYLAI